ncbi:sodium:solute symporter family protein, partial [Streptomyces sp. MCAF7]
LLASLAARQIVTKQGAAAGIVVGVTTVAVVTLSGVTVGSLLPGLPQAVKDLNVGVIALVLNIVTMAAVSAVTRTASPATAVRLRPESEATAGTG